MYEQVWCVRLWTVTGIRSMVHVDFSLVSGYQINVADYYRSWKRIGNTVYLPGLSCTIVGGGGIIWQNGVTVGGVVENQLWLSPWYCVCLVHGVWTIFCMNWKGLSQTLNWCHKLKHFQVSTFRVRWNCACFKSVVWSVISSPEYTVLKVSFGDLPSSTF